MDPAKRRVLQLGESLVGLANEETEMVLSLFLVKLLQGYGKSDQRAKELLDVRVVIGLLLLQLVLLQQVLLGLFLALAVKVGFLGLPVDHAHFHQLA